MSQLQWQDQGQSLGWRQWSQSKVTTETHQGERWLPWTNHHWSQDTLGRDGRLVSPRKTIWQIIRLRFDSTSNQRGDQGRGAGCAISHAVHLPSRKPFPLSLRKEWGTSKLARCKGRDEIRIFGNGMLKQIPQKDWRSVSYVIWGFDQSNADAEGWYLLT